MKVKMEKIYKFDEVINPNVLVPFPFFFKDFVALKHNFIFDDRF